MKTKFFFIVISLFLVTSIYSQTINLTFTAIENTEYVQLDSIKVMNQTLGGDTILYYPDTVLSLIMTSVNEVSINENKFKLFQNYPNPVNKQSKILVHIPSSGSVLFTVTDILGRLVFNSDIELEKGTNLFLFTPGDCELYFLTAYYQNTKQSIKILCSSPGFDNKLTLKFIESKYKGLSFKASTSVQNFLFNYGNELLYIGYYDSLQSGMLHSPVSDELYTFQFATNIPCPGTPTVTYEGQVYNTIQILSQCWLKENLNVGVMIPGDQGASDNEIIEKYCFANIPDSCQKSGGLYSWWEMMQYTTEEGSQGICPPGWHLPSDEEWKILEGSVDNLNGVGSVTWDMWGLRGFDGGKNLKSETRWSNGGNGLDLYGFAAIPGGRKWGNSNWHFSKGYWWSSTTVNNSGAWHRILSPSDSGIERKSEDNSFALSVRCIKD